MPFRTTEYLGDGVYIHYDGYGLELRANHHANPTDKVYLEPDVMEALQRYWTQAKAGTLIKWEPE